MWDLIEQISLTQVFLKCYHEIIITVSSFLGLGEEVV